MKDAALITIHGQGKVKERYFEELEEKLIKYLGEDWGKISFKNIQYAPILQEPQDKLWSDMKSNPENDLDSTKLRKFFLYGFSDAATLEHSAHKDPIKYLEVQKEIQNKISEAYTELGEDKSKPIIIIAQSLGCQVLANYLWDAEHNKNIFKETNEVDKDKNEFLKLKSLQNLITTGCNIPLFVGGLKVRKCFKKPNAKFEWDNYYDPDDVLGWPLKDLGKSFNIVNDHHINAGRFLGLKSWNPASHGEYWTDRDVIKPLVKKIRKCLH